MINRRRIAECVGVALALLTMHVAAVPSARAYTCSIEDIGKAAKNAYDYIPSGCAAQFSNPNFWLLTAFLAGATQVPEVKDACLAVMNANAEVPGYQDKVKSLWDKLPAGVQQELQSNATFQNAQSGAGDLVGALSIMSCACTMVTNEALGDLHQELSQCVGTALCAAQDWANKTFGDAFQKCSGDPPPPPQLIDCRENPCPGTFGCNESLPFVGGVGASTGPPGYHCEGSYCFSTSVLAGQGGTYCFCPKAMQKKEGGYVGDITLGDYQSAMYCACPAGTEPAGATGAAAYVCLCKGTGMPVGDDGKCAPAPPKCDCGCPNNQVILAKDSNTCTCSCGCPAGQSKVGDQCVTPCAIAGDIRLASGSCCAPSQATSCGVCCPAGMKPDNATGGCVSPAPIQIWSPPTLQQQLPGQLQKKR